MPKHLRMFYKPGTAAGWLAALRWDFRTTVRRPANDLDRTDALFPVLTDSEHGHRPQPLPLDQHEPFLADIVAKAFFEAVKKISWSH